MDERWTMVEREQQTRLFKAGWIRGTTDPLTLEDKYSWETAYRMGYFQGRRAHSAARKEFDKIRDDSLLHKMARYHEQEG